MPIQQDIFIKNYVNEIRDNNAAVFAGAGLSLDAGLVNWKQLLQPIADELGLNIDKEHDLISVAQYHVNKNGNNRGVINQHLIDSFKTKGNITGNHQILSRLPIKTYWTTNYDKLIEKSLEKNGKIVDVKHTVKQLANTVSGRDAVVYKMHGDVDHPDDAVVTKDDYEKYHIAMTPFTNALTGDLISKTFLFVGFSFEDPNLDYILSRVRIALGGSQRRHFCILKKENKLPRESDDDFKYKKLKQKYFIEDLKRFNISTILIDEYLEINTILKKIEYCLKQKNIFISGAIADFNKHPKEDVENFLKQLSGKLIQKGYTIVTGFGLGVGNSIICGALNEIYMKRTGKKEQLIIRPFPQTNDTTIDKKELWTQYRKNMLSLCGVAIFVYGNKFQDAKTINSNGMKEEFEIAKNFNVFLLPVGGTDYMAKELYTETYANYDTYNVNYNPAAKGIFPYLNESNFSPIAAQNDIIKILNLISN